ncbi:hypothetical protein M409DRAFT_36276 [Zasmidium cellare ATCC 36951]|uniref:Ribosome biogenesis protein YTM1 n=1 Tax=Zasmidium cellare ATCC 36951 TaxID=1080233 RepID=A0A6A6CNX5_ZASCE|nr:uncharacterized protein M409DRAFT_36276 [Zasmidium cellare ATCC 36951]KAF2168761.1 hypothetical protein M409DRAFT_36276 [Zasmidium cellare ATCC 36951]
MAANGQADRAAQVRIQLKTKDGEIELPQETGPILVSTELKRYQLSTLVNRLLDTEKPVPLEFLINGQFLRTSLDEFLTQNGISAETLLNVEYVKALVPPLHVASYEHDDWISSVDVLSLSSEAAQWTSTTDPIQNRILSGSFDGSLRVWNTSGNAVATGQWHKSRVNAAKFLSPTQVVSGSVDRSVLLWDYKDSQTSTGTLKPKLELLGHTSSVEDVAVHAPSSRILTASSDHQIGIWSTKKSEGPAALEPTTTPSSNKRRKISGPEITIPQRGALSLLPGHRSSVNSIIFDSTDPTVAYSISSDHSLKTWDLPTTTCIDTRTTATALTSLCHLPDHGLIAVGSAERHISLIDPRANATKVVAMTLRGHSGWIQSLAKDPSSSYQFVSGSNDGTCRIWDIRSGGNEAGGERVGHSVFVIERESQKGAKKAETGDASRVFGVAWDQEVGIVSGGRDKMLQINRG